MERIDWSKAPHWADRVVRSPRQRQLFWADDNSRQYFVIGQRRQDKQHIRDNWEVVERRPEFVSGKPSMSFSWLCNAEPAPITIEQRIASLRALEKQVEETRAELTRDLEALGLTWMVRDEPTIKEHSPKPGKFNNARIGSPTKFDYVHSDEICDSCGERFGQHIGVSCRP